MLNKGDHVPRFECVTIDDIRVNYADVWQKKNLALLCLSEDSSPEAQSYIQQLREALPALAVHDAVVVVTTTPIDGMPLPGCAVADRWGQMQWVTSAERIVDLPSPREIAAWLQFVEIQCPECEGEVH
jgi:hypothetical protein